MNEPTLRYGDTGESVKKWQRFLLANEYDLGIWKDDGKNFFATTSATERLQRKYGILPVDGVVGKQSWEFARKHNFARIENESAPPIPRIKIDPLEGDWKTAVGSLLTPEGYRLILDYEVGGGRDYYNKKLLHPVLPPAYSGITIGIGWDLRFNTVKQFDEAWHILLERWIITLADYNRLRDLCGKDGTKSALNSVKHIEIPWEVAEEVFCRFTVPRFSSLAHNVFPELEKAHPWIRDAIISLVFNRGGSLRGSRRKFMRGIKAGILHHYYYNIPTLFRKMKTYWKDILGLLRRRDAEADLAQKGVDVWKRSL